jgi:hypothetical protein
VRFEVDVEARWMWIETWMHGCMDAWIYPFLWFNLVSTVIVLEFV